jgi:hypothetical protein
MRRVIIATGIGLVFVSGCGGSSTPPSPVATGVVIVAPEGVLYLGVTYTFTANGQLSNGTTNAAAGTWGSDAPSVATVSSTGQVQIVGLGEATIFVDAQGMRGTRRIRSTVNYAGEIDGALRVTGCSQSGVFAQNDACDEASNGTLFRFLGEFSQNGGNVVVATMDLVDWPAEPVTATVNGAGELRFTSEHRQTDDGLEFVGTAQWVFRPRGLTQIEGTAVWRMRIAGLAGTWELRGTIPPLSRSAAGSDSRGARPVADVLRRLRR